MRRQGALRRLLARARRSAAPPGIRLSMHRRLLSSSKFSDREKEVLRSLSSVVDETGSDVVYQGLIEGVKTTDEGLVSISLQLTEDYRNLKKQCQAAVEQLPWVDKCRVSMAAKPTRLAPPKGGGGGGGAAEAASKPNGLRLVKNTIAVSSCKGGVGKSTVSVNLAYTLARKGYSVGIFDADIHGPSLPTMLTPADPVLRLGPEDLIVAPVYLDVKLMSYGFSKPFDPLSTDEKLRQSTIMRGPMAAGVVQRLATDTDWGDLDYLVVDFPPGTGDIQLTLAQTLNFDSAVIVTTPQRLAHVDVVKGMDMFDKVKVPLVTMVNNMAYLECPCGKQLFPFGKGKTEKLADLFGMDSNIISLPIVQEISEHGDTGDPVVTSEDPELAEVVKAYELLAEDVVRETAAIKEAKSKTGRSSPEVKSEGRTLSLTKLDGETVTVDAVTLRKSCKSAGNQNPELVDDTVRATDIVPRGNYAVSIAWTDGHLSIFPYDHIEQVAAAQQG